MLGSPQSSTTSSVQTFQNHLQSSFGHVPQLGYGYFPGVTITYPTLVKMKLIDSKVPAGNGICYFPGGHASFCHFLSCLSGEKSPGFPSLTFHV